jgi:multiple sugar transport system permease protein
MKKIITRSLYHILLWFIALIFFSPVLWIFISAFKSKDVLLSIPPKWAFAPTFDNFIATFTGNQFGPNLVNSVAISFSAVLIALVVSFLAAYSFSRYKPKGTDFMMFLLLSMRMVPGAACVVPLYLMYAAFGWTNSHLSIILFYTMFSIPFSVWILKGYIDGVSVRFDETVLVCGGSRWQVMMNVVLPQVKPGLVAAFIFNMVFVWNEFLFNFILGGKNVTTIPVSLANGLYTSLGVDWPFIASAALIYTVPLIVVVFLFQKYLLIGMTFGTVRGEV